MFWGCLMINICMKVYTLLVTSSLSSLLMTHLENTQLSVDLTLIKIRYFGWNMRSELSLFQFCSAFLLSQSFSISPRNETELFKKLKEHEPIISDQENVTVFTYTIHRYPTNPDTNLSREAIEEIIENAFSLHTSWQEEKRYWKSLISVFFIDAD